MNTLFESDTITDVQQVQFLLPLEDRLRERKADFIRLLHLTQIEYNDLMDEEMQNFGIVEPRRVEVARLKVKLAILRYRIAKINDELEDYGIGFLLDKERGAVNMAWRYYRQVQAEGK